MQSIEQIDPRLIARTLDEGASTVKTLNGSHLIALFIELNNVVVKAKNVS